MLRSDIVNQFAPQLRGPIYRPTDAEYDSVRPIYNAMIDRRPAEIVCCRDAADVMAAVDVARENDELLAIRCGGHSGPGLSTCEGGLVIDLSGMRGVRVDADAGTVRVEGGARWGDVDHATHPFGLAVPSGVISTTGVGGLTLGGGHGYLARQYGLTIDSLLEVDIVLANGRMVKASEDKNPDLFWAIRGGGGNFGVVTSFLFSGHPVKNVYGGPMMWPLEQGEERMRWYQDMITSAPNDVYAWFGLVVVPPSAPFPEEIQGERMWLMQWCNLGSRAEAEARFESAREGAPPAFEHVGEMPFPALQSMFDQFYPSGLQWYWKGDFFDSLSDDAIALHMSHAARVPTGLSTMHIYPINGAVQAVDATETAWGHRDVTFSVVYAGVSDRREDADTIIGWARDYYDALHPHSSGAAYVNFMMDEGEERIRATYGGNYERLQRVKAKYDPDNLFRVNQNIVPAR